MEQLGCVDQFGDGERPDAAAHTYISVERICTASDHKGHRTHLQVSDGAPCESPTKHRRAKELNLHQLAPK